jgi:lysyl-tRNA synthetase class 2
MRSRQVKGWLADGKFNPYPHKFQTDFDPTTFHEKYNYLAKGETLKGKTEYRLGGRIITQRASGNKLRFYDVQCQGIMIQVMAQLNEATDQASFLEVHDRFQRVRATRVLTFDAKGYRVT